MVYTESELNQADIIKISHQSIGQRIQRIDSEIGIVDIGCSQ